MFNLFKKKPKYIPSKDEIERDKIDDELFSARKTIETRTIDIYILNKSLIAYPKGSADYDDVKKEIEIKQKMLLNNIAYYDELRSKYIEVNARLNDSWCSRAPSHEVVCYAIRRFLEK